MATKNVIKKIIKDWVEYFIYSTKWEVEVDSALSDTSENPVQNKVVKSAIDWKITNPSDWTAGQVLKKTSSWESWWNVNEVPSWWTVWQVLKRTANGSEWWDTPKTYTTIQVTLTSAWWSNNTQTVQVNWVTASNTVIVSPDPSNFSDYTEAVIYCSWQWAWTLTFTCDSEPSSDLLVNIVVLD